MKNTKISNLNNIKNIYFLGIAGQLMSGLACTAKSFGFNVTGSDAAAYPPATTSLETHGISWIDGHSETNIGNPDLIVLGNHIRQDNPELQFIIKNNLPFVSYPEMIQLMFPNSKYRFVVAGTHGKSTTTALLGWTLVQAGLDPTVFIGAQSKNFASQFRVGSNNILVIEGDEYTSSCLDSTPKFLYYNPTHAILTSAELDHIDVFDTWEKQSEMFKQFCDLVSQNLLLCADSQVPQKINLTAVKAAQETYGLTSADWQAKDITYTNGLTNFNVYHQQKLIDTFTTKLVGNHFIQNALAVIALCKKINISTEIIKQALLSFTGIGRRFEILAEKNNIVVIDDYAHHPTAIKVTLDSARKKYPDQNIICVYEPHTYSRILGLLPRFKDVFNSANKVIISDIYAAREKNLQHTVNSTDIISNANHSNIAHIPNPEAVLNYLITELKPNDVVIFMTVSQFNNNAHKLADYVNGTSEV